MVVGAAGSRTGEQGQDRHRPGMTGGLDGLLADRPVFRVRLNGYDRLEVDNYAAWAEEELSAARRQADHLLNQFGACSAELEISRRLLADAPRGRQVFPVSERVQEMLRLAAEEAAALTDAGAEEAERLVTDARTEADARLRKAHEIKEHAVRSGDEILEHARGVAAAQVERARAEAAAILREATAERDRLAEEAVLERQRATAEATEQLAGVRAEVADLRRQRDDARESMRRLTDRIGEALRAVVGDLPGDEVAERPQVRTVMVDNVVADLPPLAAAPDGPAKGTTGSRRVKERPEPVPS